MATIGINLDAVPETLATLRAWFDYHAYEVGLEPEPMANALFSAAGRLFAQPPPVQLPGDAKCRKCQRPVNYGEGYYAFAALGGATTREHIVCPDPTPPAEADACPKCDHDGIGMVYHRNEYACGYDYREQHLAEHAGEHLHRHCQRCHYEWIEECVTP